MSEEQFRRAISIFSVVSSPSRLEILRQLNSKGPMSYSELKSSTGFRAKKESGKFAYHLRKLLRQGLVQHNRLDKKYSITPLGRLVLNAAREIDERALLHIEQVMVRTSHETLEPFNANRLMQGLLKEARTSRDVAQKVASEIEHVVAGREGLYLTTPMIRWMASYLLLMEGRDEESARLAKLGISVWDLEALSPSGVQEALREAGARALRERELFFLYPKDVVDAHLEGEMNIRDVGTSALAPDSVSVPLDRSVQLEELLSLALFTRVELSLVVRDGWDASELRRLLLSSESALRVYGWPVLLNAVLLDESLVEVAEGLGGTAGSRLSFTLAFRGSSRRAAELASRGLAVSTSPRDSLRSFTGAPVDPEVPMVSVVGASINMPRLAYETQGDDAYFSARLLQVVEKAASALEHRMKSLSGLLGGRPGLRGAEVAGFINLIGYYESPPAARLGSSLVELVGDKGVSAAFMYDHKSAQRLRRLDAERMPPSELPRAAGWVMDGYTSGIYSPPQGDVRAPPAPAYANVVQSHEVKGEVGEGVSVIPTFRVCRACGALNPPGLTSCSKCGSSALEPLYVGALAP